MAMTPEVELIVKLGAAAGHASLIWQLWKAWREHELRLRLDTVTDPDRRGIDLQVLYNPRRRDRRFTTTVEVLSPEGATVAPGVREALLAEDGAPVGARHVVSTEVAGVTASGVLAHIASDARGDVGALFYVGEASGPVKVRVLVRSDTGRRMASLTRTVTRA